MKLYYVANSKLPTVKAHGVQIIKMCEAFVKAGFECELVIPKRNRYPGTGEDGILAYYGLKTLFKITEIKSLDFAGINLGSFFNKILFWIQQFSFTRSLKKYLAGKEGVVYSRDQFSVSMLDSGKNKLYWEAHNFPRKIKSSFYQNVFKKINGLVVISEGLKKDFSRYYNDDILVAPDGVDLEQFNVKISKEEARKRLNLPFNKKIVIYAGHLYKWKGTASLLEVAKNFQFSIFNFQKKTEDVLFVFVGGTERDVDKFRKKSKGLGNVLILGNRPYNEIPLYLKAADCAVLTGNKSEKISEKYTSPLKMFEYMASGCPIVAQDLPSFREVINESNSILVEAENTEALASGIKTVFENGELADRISQKSFKDVQKYTWLKRAEKIRNFMKN